MLKKAILQVPYGKKSVVECTFHKITEINSRSARFPKNRNLHREGFPVNKTKFLVLLQKGHGDKV